MVPLDGLYEGAHFNIVDSGRIIAQHDPLAAQEKHPLLNAFTGHDTTHFGTFPSEKSPLATSSIQRRKRHVGIVLIHRV